MEHFEISRPTLREAFRVLESEALIASVRRGARRRPRPHSGRVTSRPGTPGWSCSSGVRRSPMCTRARAGDRAGRHRAARPRRVRLRLEAVAGELEESEAAEDGARIVILQEQFHRLIVEAAGNQTLTIFEGDDPPHHRAPRLRVRRPEAQRPVRGESGDDRHASRPAFPRPRDRAAPRRSRHLVGAAPGGGADVVLRGADAKTVLELLD